MMLLEAVPFCSPWDHVVMVTNSSPVSGTSRTLWLRERSHAASGSYFFAVCESLHFDGDMFPKAFCPYHHAGHFPTTVRMNSPQLGVPSLPLLCEDDKSPMCAVQERGETSAHL